MFLKREGSWRSHGLEQLFPHGWARCGGLGKKEEEGRVCLGWGTWRKQLRSWEMEATLEALLPKLPVKEEETGV